VRLIARTPPEHTRCGEWQVVLTVSDKCRGKSRNDETACASLRCAPEIHAACGELNNGGGWLASISFLKGWLQTMRFSPHRLGPRGGRDSGA
jgi:hypothetical protein